MIKPDKKRKTFNETEISNALELVIRMAFIQSKVGVPLNLELYVSEKIEYVKRLLDNPNRRTAESLTKPTPRFTNRVTIVDHKH